MVHFFYHTGNCWGENLFKLLGQFPSLVVTFCERYIRNGGLAKHLTLLCHFRCIVLNLQHTKRAHIQGMERNLIQGPLLGKQCDFFILPVARTHLIQPWIYNHDLNLSYPRHAGYARLKVDGAAISSWPQVMRLEWQLTWEKKGKQSTLSIH